MIVMERVVDAIHIDDIDKQWCWGVVVAEISVGWLSGLTHNPTDISMQISDDELMPQSETQLKKLIKSGDSPQVFQQ